MKIEGLIQEIKKSNSGINTDAVQKAYNFANEAHSGQERQEGKPYISHPIRVANIIVKMNLDTETVVAAILHDVLEDTSKTENEIKKEFGAGILKLVQGLTKISKLEYQGKIRYAENLKKMILALSDDIRVAFIKLADRLDNMRTLRYLPQEKQKLKAQETLEIYAPIANRLGIGWLKGELEDLSFPYLYPDQYSWLMAQVQKKFDARQKYLKKIRPKVENFLKKERLDIMQIDYRAKHYWSLYLKLQKYGMDINKIYDLVAFRIIVPNISQCYGALGAIHKYWPPLMGRVKDYIATPKPNGYQSLHTTVICEDGQITEFQIRTPEMHQRAEFGISAHWYYAEQKGLRRLFKKFAARAPEKNLALVKQLRELEEKIKKSSPQEIFNAVKIDFFKNRIYVFTPQGDVIELPENSCSIDFAYAIHTDVGNHCSLAKINKIAKSLYTPLKNGDIVEIITDKNRRPSSDWLNFVKTHEARNAIKKSITKETTKVITPEKESFFKKIIKKIPGLPIKAKQEKVLVSNIEGALIFFPKCCKPKPGSEISGYITKDKGVAIHDSKCKTLNQLKEKFPDRIIQVSWQNAIPKIF